MDLHDKFGASERYRPSSFSKIIGSRFSDLRKHIGTATLILFVLGNIRVGKMFALAWEH